MKAKNLESINEVAGAYLRLLHVLVELDIKSAYSFRLKIISYMLDRNYR